MTQEAYEQLVRKLRDNIYGQSSDECWDACKANWLLANNAAWLLSQPQNKQVKDELFSSIPPTRTS